jgi:hypothetical protein
MKLDLSLLFPADQASFSNSKDGGNLVVHMKEKKKVSTIRLCFRSLM